MKPQSQNHVWINKFSQLHRHQKHDPNSSEGGLGTQLEIGLRTRKSLHVKGGSFGRAFLLSGLGVIRKGIILGMCAKWCYFYTIFNCLLPVFFFSDKSCFFSNQKHLGKFCFSSVNWAKFSFLGKIHQIFNIIKRKLSLPLVLNPLLLTVKH